MNLVKGTKEADFLQGVLHDINQMHGYFDSDALLGGRRGDYMVGGPGDDMLWGDAGNDVMEGNTGYDVIYGSNGDDQIKGGDGNDFISGGKDDDWISAGKGDDVLSGNSGDDTLLGNSGDDYLFGTGGNDTLDGGAGNDWLSGGSGDDRLMVSSGSDSYTGGSGFDTLDFSRMGGRIDLDLSKHTASVSGMQSFVSKFEQVTGNDAGGRFMGDKHDTVFVGGAGDDWFRGKGGADTFTGGDGSDTFVWLKKDVTDGKGVDVVTDFQVGTDRLDLSDFVKGGQSYDDVINLVQTDAGVLVRGEAKGQWVDIALLEGLDMGDDGMTLADVGIGMPAGDAASAAAQDDGMGMPGGDGIGPVLDGGLLLPDDGMGLLA